MEWQFFFKRLPTWVRRNLRNLACSGSAIRSPDSQNQSESWWDPGFQNISEKKRHPLLSSIWPFQKKKKNSGYLPKRTPFVMSPTTYSCVRCKSRYPFVGLTSSKMQLSSPWTGTRCGRDMVPNGPTHQRHPTQLHSKWTAALSLSTDSLPKLTVAVRMKTAVSQLQRL